MLGIQNEQLAIQATQFHPNKKYLRRKNILILLSGTIIIASSMMMSVACLWYSSMENRYEAEENKHEHDEGIEAQFFFGNGFHAGIVAAVSTFLSALMIIRPYDKSEEHLPSPGKDEKVHVFSFSDGNWEQDTDESDLEPAKSVFWKLSANFEPRCEQQKTPF